jgi:hypothetical protein
VGRHIVPARVIRTSKDSIASPLPGSKHSEGLISDVTIQNEPSQATAQVLLRHDLDDSSEDTFFYNCRDICAYNKHADSPLSKCAWVLQEPLLAPRALYFNTTELFWTCKELLADLSFPDGFDRNCNPVLMMDGPLFLSWKNIVRLYTTCNLTYGRISLQHYRVLQTTEYVMGE